jgi:hypothetical protein
MRLIKRTAILFFFAIAAMSCGSGRMSKSNITVAPLSGKTSVSDGSIVYALPRTVFTVVVDCEKTIQIPGPYGQYAGDLLGIDNVIKEESENWSIEAISVKTHEEIDPSAYYVVEGTSVFESNVLALRNEGLILDLAPEMYYSMGNRTGEAKSSYSGFLASDLGSDEYFQVQRDTAFKRVNVDSTFVRIPYIVEKKKKLADEQLAERAAKRLLELRDGKHLILTGEANVFPQSDAALNEMNRLEKEYTELFTGKTIREKRTFTYQVIPSKEIIGKPINLFQFSELTGPSEGVTQGGGDPVIMQLIPEKKTADLNVFTGKSQDQKPGKLYYRVPDVVNLKISAGDEVLFNSRRLVYQFGQIVQLPSNFIIGK